MVNEIKYGEIARQQGLIIKAATEMLTKHFCILLIPGSFCSIRFAHAKHAVFGVMMQGAFLQGPHCFPCLYWVRAILHTVICKAVDPIEFCYPDLRFKRFGGNAKLVTIGRRRPVVCLHSGMIAGFAQGH
eukprot:5848278-Ditylum_brightwellii.AAC.2